MNRKIIQRLANISPVLEDWLYIGNIDTTCDLGHTKDYLRMQWLQQQDQPKDFVIASGVQYTVLQFIE